MVDPDKKKNVDIIKRENGEAMAFVETLIGRIIIYLPMGRFGATKVTRVVVHVVSKLLKWHWHKLGIGKRKANSYGYRTRDKY
jgi:hypothetical protein